MILHTIQDANMSKTVSTVNKYYTAVHHMTVRLITLHYGFLSAKYTVVTVMATLHQCNIWTSQPDNNKAYCDWRRQHFGSIYVTYNTASESVSCDKSISH